jgi:sigma-B regulation protein RsbU (phosphoserine phosphatase)
MTPDEATLSSPATHAIQPHDPGEPSPTGSFAAPAPRRSIREFLSDGSLTRLCAELSDLLTVDVQLLDEKGHRILPAEGESRWRAEEHASDLPPDATQIDLRLGNERIGQIVLMPGEPTLGPRAREQAARALTLVGEAVSELCRDDEDLRHRVKEIGALYQLSGLLVQARGVEQILQVALEAALEALGLDAGNVVLLPDASEGVASESEEDLRHISWRGLSDAWINSPLPLSRHREFDVLALKGEVVTSENLLKDERVLIQKQVRAERVASFINAGLVVRGRPIGVIRLYGRSPRTFTEWDKRLIRSIGQQAAAAVDQARLMRVEDHEKQVQRQLALAKDVQGRMLPRSLPALPALDIAAKYEPSLELGGDFYDVFELGGQVGIVVGDVVGKGIAAALLMSHVRATLRAHVQDVYHIDEVMRRVNRALCRDTLESEFTSAWYGVVDPASLRLTYVSAGHEPPFVIRRHADNPTPEVIELRGGGLVLGIDPTERYERTIYDLKPGDIVVTYTDGLMDTRNFAGDKLGRKKLEEAVQDLVAREGDQPGGVSAQRVIDHLMWTIRQFAGLMPKPDDITIVVLRLT